MSHRDSLTDEGTLRRVQRQIYRGHLTTHGGVSFATTHGKPYLGAAITVEHGKWLAEKWCGVTAWTTSENVNAGIGAEKHVAIAVLTEPNDEGHEAIRETGPSREVAERFLLGTLLESAAAEGGHHVEIDALRQKRNVAAGNEEAHILGAAAALLECHDATGINLCTFGDVEHFVNDVLREVGFGPVRNNGV